MTDEEIDAMPAGREMDALIAEKVFGYQIIICDPTGFNFSGNVGPCLVDAPKDQWGEMPYVPNYSTDISATWTVVNVLIGRGDLFLESRQDGEWFVCNKPLGVRVGAIGARCDGKKTGAMSLPLAVCRAALKAISHA